MNSNHVSYFVSFLAWWHDGGSYVLISWFLKKGLDGGGHSKFKLTYQLN